MTHKRAGTSGHLLTIGVASCIALAFTGVWLWNSGLFDGLRSGRTLQLFAPDAGGIVSGSSVRIAGLEVGQVTGVQRDGTGALITTKLFELKRGIPADSRFAIRLRTLAGENYVEISPGHARTAVPNGGLLGMSQAEQYVAPDQVLSVFEGATRQRARALIQALGTGIGDSGTQLNGTIAGFSGLAQDISPVLDVAYADRPSISRIIANLGLVMQAIGQRTAATETLASSYRSTMTAIAARDTAVEGTIQRLPGALDQIRAATATLERISNDATPVVANLASVLIRIRPAVGDLGPASNQTVGILHDLSLAEPGLKTTLDELRTVAPPTSDTLPKVKGVLCQLLPMARYLKPYTPDILAAVIGLGSATNWYDANAHAARLFPTVGTNNPVLLNAQMATLANQLLANGVQVIHKTRILGYTPLMPPGGSLNTTVGRGVIGPAEVTQKYPHLLPAC
ncbi:MAG: MlaD family protein [Solirubrobacteraceae bacterium]